MITHRKCCSANLKKVKKKSTKYEHTREKIFFFFLGKKFIKNYDPFFSLENLSIYIIDDVEMHSNLKDCKLYFTHHSLLI